MRILGYILLIFGGFGAAVWLSWSCKDQITGADLNAIVFPAKNVSYSKYVQPFFDRGCGGQNSSCHGPETFNQNGFALDVYDHVIASISVVSPGAPDASELILSIEGRFGQKMPPADLPQPNANQITGLRQWIKEGAQNN